MNRPNAFIGNVDESRALGYWDVGIRGYIVGFAFRTTWKHEAARGGRAARSKVVGRRLGRGRSQIADVLAHSPVFAPLGQRERLELAA
jgi:hypothetical protein